MDTKVWGPAMWKTLHLITFSYPEKPSFGQKKQHYDFFNNLRYTIPCIFCRKNYIDHLNEIPLEPHLDNNILLIKWLIDIHNLVNKQLNKPHKTYEKVFSMYRDIMAEKYTKVIQTKSIFQKFQIFQIFNNKYVKICIIILLIGLIYNYKTAQSASI